MAIKQEPLEQEELLEKLEESGLFGSELEDAIRTIERINMLKKQKHAVVLAHYYVRDAIKLGIADYVGDSLDLSIAAKETDADIIVFCGVHFMAETAKMLNPKKKVLLPDLEAGCSLAESITAEDVRQLREQYPAAAIATYINTTAEVKAETDVVVTSANVLRVLRQLPQKQIVFIPDIYMGKNIKEELPEKEIISWHGSCIVHEQFTTGQIDKYKHEYPGLKVLAHYECPKEVIQAADMHGGTSDMRRYVRETDEQAYLLATECGLASTIKNEFPSKNIVGPCTLCPYMKKNDLYNTLQVLETEQPEITLTSEVQAKAVRSVERMFELS